MKGRITALLADENADLMVTVKIDKQDRKTLRETVARLREGDVEISLKIYIEKRTLSANAYFWVLCGKVAEALGVDKDEVYQAHIMRQGIYKVVEINNDAADTFIHAWGMNGTGWLCEKTNIGAERTTLRAYYGSSVYNKKQMARLIDGLVQDAQNIGVETKTPEEIAKMLNLMEAQNV